MTFGYSPDNLPALNFAASPLECRYKRWFAVFPEDDGPLNDSLVGCAPGEFALEMHMAKTFAALALVVLSATASFAGNCQHDNDHASDGSRCGGRSSDSRPGGR